MATAKREPQTLAPGALERAQQHVNDMVQDALPPVVAGVKRGARPHVAIIDYRNGGGSVVVGEESDWILDGGERVKLG